MMRCPKHRVVMDARAGLFRCPRGGCVVYAKTRAGLPPEKVNRPGGAAVMV